MSPCTVGGLASGTAHCGHIRHKNYEFISTKGPAPTSAHSYDPNLYHGDPRHIAHSELTLKTAYDGSILEFTYLDRPVPSLTASHGQASHSGNQRSMARNELAQGMASTGHILLGNHVVNHTKGSTPASALSCDPNQIPRSTADTLSEIILRGCIPECTCVGGLVPSLITDQSQDFYPGSQMAMAYGDPAQGMASTNHILLGNHSVNHTKGPMPVSTLSCDPDLHLEGLDPPTVHSGHTLRTALRGCIPECTYVGAQCPLSSRDKAKTS
jgi:hypothetical protein